MPTPETLEQAVPDWNISTSCDVALGPLLRELSTAEYAISFEDISADAIRETLKDLGPDVKPQYPVHVQLTHGRNMDAPDELGSHELVGEGTDHAYSLIKIRMTGFGRPSLRLGFEANATLVHELQHALDYNDSTREFVKKTDRVYMREHLKATSLAAVTVLGSAAVGAYTSWEYFQNLPRYASFLASNILGIGIAAKAYSPLTNQANKRAYHKSPLEHRARLAAISAYKFPSAIQTNYNRREPEPEAIKVSA